MLSIKLLHKYDKIMVKNEFSYKILVILIEKMARAG